MHGPQIEGPNDEVGMRWRPRGERVRADMVGSKGAAAWTWRQDEDTMGQWVRHGGAGPLGGEGVGVAAALR
jgi:hypothetical protein